MTFKERLTAERPERIGDRYIAGAQWLPLYPCIRRIFRKTLFDYELRRMLES